MPEQSQGPCQSFFWAILFAITLGLARSVCAQVASPVSGAGTITCAELKEKPARATWLSLPQSRLVVNPTMSAAAPVPAAVAPCLPVNVAYYSGETPIRLPYLWSWFAPERALAADVAAGPAADFSPRSASLWKLDRANASFAGSEVRLSVGQVPFGSITTPMTVDLDKTPTLLVRVPRSDGQWALKVNPGQEAIDTYVQADTTQTGTFAYDLPTLTGWHGKRTFKLILFAVGVKGSTVTVADLRFAGATVASPPPVITETGWWPHQIVSQAQASGGSVKIQSHISMPDERTVAQHLRIDKAPPAAVTLMGQLPPGVTRWDDARHALIFRGQGMQFVITISHDARWLGLFDSPLDLVSAKPARTGTPGGSAWGISLGNMTAGEEVTVAASFGQPGDSTDDLLATSTKLIGAGAFQVALDQQIQAWDTRLSRVPRPLDFEVHGLDAHGVTADDIRRTYYRAWVFLLSNSLPAMPENRSAWPQVCCGKASLWNEGAPGARATSQWESFLAMQYLAFAEPELAWDAFAGQMSLVGADGSLGGEGLPSRHAQTAWVLYCLTGDRQRANRVYPSLKRLLLWKAANPRWIYHDSTPEDQKDSEFVVHALMDIEYARRLAQALDLPAEERFWQTQSAQLADSYHRWFWNAQGHSYRLFRTSTGKGESPDEPWNLQALVLPPTILRASERDALLALFRQSVRHDAAFLIPGLAGFPKYNFTLRGMWQYASPAEASLMVDSALRDITLAGHFAESYTQSFPPAPIGVQPSVFGAAQMIDAALWHNGVSCGDGLPLLLSMPKARGVDNLLLKAGPVDISIDGAANRLVLQGKGLKMLAQPDGMRSDPRGDGTPRWVGELPHEVHLAPANTR